MKSTLLSGTSVAVVAGLMSVFPAQHAAAQDAEDDRYDSNSQVIIVTATKREQALTEVPLAIQAFSGEALEKSGRRDIADIIRTIPGASEGLSNSEGRRIFQIRGIGTISGDSTIGYYIDDAAFSLPNNQFAPLGRTYDVERVEVLRGPQGTLYGQGSMGGTIRFITADPDLEEFRFRGQAGVGSVEGGETSYYGDAAISVPIVKDKLGVRLVVGQEFKGGFADALQFIPQDDVNDATITNVRGKILFKPNDTVTLKGLYQSSEVEQDFTNLFDTASPPTLTTSGRPSFTNNEMEQISGFVGIDLGFATLENSIGYIDYKVDQDSELPLALGPGGSVVPVPVIQATDADTLSNETRLVSNSDGPFSWVAGVYYQDSSLAGLSLIPGLVPTNENETEQESWSVFGEASWAFFDGKLTPLVGLRYFSDERTFFDDSSTADVLTDDTLVNDNFDSLNPRFNVAFTPDADSLYYINVAKGFRSGNFNPSSSVFFGQSLGLPVDLTIDPDELWSYELGTKLVRQNGNLILEGSVYYNDWSDIQTLVNPGIAVGLNAGEAEIYGIDFSLTSTPVDGLTLQVSGNVNSAEFANIPPEVSNAVVGDLFENGQRLPFVPPYNVTLLSSYEWPLGNTGLDGFALASYTQTGAQFANEVEGEEQRILTGRLGVQTDRWGVFLFGDNLLDEDSPIYNQASPLLSTQTRAYPRTIGVELTFDY